MFVTESIQLAITKDMDPSKIKENLESQLSELETLQSMYNPGELRVEDLNVLADINAFVDGRTSDLPAYLDLTLNLSIDKQKFELCINLSHEYPDVEPDIFVRNHKLNKKQHATLNKDLTEYIASLDRMPCIFSAVTWLQDNAANYIIVEEVDEQRIEKDETLVRYWIYSHHIYSKSKRREILDLANTLNITGFCMPGKPGIICVEGTKSDCTEWWQTIKAMNWKRIFCKISEECKDSGESFLKFRTFEERVFQNCNVKCNHMNMGELFKFLEDHQCGYIFKDIFGVEAKASS
ncbi:RWD domain-containing protein 2A [Tribolium madens]|uniref:RWD domain-containing protein 2A n=1 Tax=Tribolium madens TaxID=41895 RepID=UPI001CF7669E|nr:RWD domain-containing protein 2A [Tribolium madens]